MSHEPERIPAEKVISSALAEAWLQGQHEKVKTTIHCTGNCEARRMWKDETAKVLPAGEREQFLNYMRG